MLNQKLRRVVFALIVVTGPVALLFANAGQKKGPAGSVFVSDKGKLKILLADKPMGQETFDIAPGGGGWIAKGTTRLTPEGSPAVTVTGSLALQPNGVPISYEWTSQSDKTNGAQVLFANGVARMTLHVQGARPFQQDFTFSAPLVVVLDDNLYHQYAVLAQLYDWSRRGTQSFSVLIPQELTPGSISVDSVGAVTVEGKSYEGLKVVTNDLEVLLYLDSNHRLMRMEVPSSKAAIIRE